jgi:cytochrome c oxidase assembly protein subunit 20
MLFSLANYEYCLYRRQMEKDGMKRAVEIVAQKKSEKVEAMRIKKEERRKAKEEADRKEEEERRKKSWKFW